LFQSVKSHFWGPFLEAGHVDQIFVLSDRRLGAIAEWQQAIDAEGFDLRLFEDLSGHLPAHRGEQHAGFECGHWDPWTWWMRRVARASISAARLDAPWS
jgi:hypothetical protein